MNRQPHPLKIIVTCLELSAVLVAIVLLTTPIASAAPAVVAIYDGGGSWRSGRIMMQNLLDSHGVKWDEVNAAEINTGKLDGYRLLWFPGGWAPSYLRQITDRGDENIRNFVKKGGGYIGSCAGAYYGSDRVDWRGTKYEYSLNLFAGTAAGDIASITTYPNFALTGVVLDPAHPMNAGLNPNRQQLYGGGPYFVPDNPAAISTAGRYQVDKNKPAVIAFNYGAGRVVLAGTHPEIGLKYASCDCATRGAGPDQGADWDFAWAMVQWALGQSKPATSATPATRATDAPSRPSIPTPIITSRTFQPQSSGKYPSWTMIANESRSATTSSTTVSIHTNASISASATYSGYYNSARSVGGSFKNVSVEW